MASREVVGKSCSGELLGFQQIVKLQSSPRSWGIKIEGIFGTVAAIWIQTKSLQHHRLVRCQCSVSDKLC